MEELQLITIPHLLVDALHCSGPLDDAEAIQSAMKAAAESVGAQVVGQAEVRYVPHGVTAVLEVNKEVGAWLLRQESIFWSLAEVAEMEDEDLAKSLAEVYAHAANDP